MHRDKCVFSYILEVFTNVQQCKNANTGNFVLPVSLEMSNNTNSVECQPFFFRQPLLHTEQVTSFNGSREWLVTGVGPCTVRSKFNKFEYVWSGCFCTGGHVQRVLGTCTGGAKAKALYRENWDTVQ